MGEKRTRQENFFWKIALSLIFCILTLSGSGWAAADEAAPAAYAASVECYVLVNDEWQLITVKEVSQQAKFGSQTRYYITADALEEVYGQFGFSAASYAGERIFPHTDINDTSLIWADAAPVSAEGQWRIPLSFRDRILLFYTPANVPGSTSYFTSSAKRSDAALIQDNTFYSITISDPSGIAPGESREWYQRPGSEVNVSLPISGSVNWHAIDNRLQVELTPDEKWEENGRVFFRFSDLRWPIKITNATQEMAYTIQYNAATVAESLKTLG